MGFHFIGVEDFGQFFDFNQLVVDAILYPFPIFQYSVVSSNYHSIRALQLPGAYSRRMRSTLS